MTGTEEWEKRGGGGLGKSKSLVLKVGGWEENIFIQNSFLDLSF